MFACLLVCLSLSANLLGWSGFGSSRHRKLVPGANSTFCPSAGDIDLSNLQFIHFNCKVRCHFTAFHFCTSSDSTFSYTSSVGDSFNLKCTINFVLQSCSTQDLRCRVESIFFFLSIVEKHRNKLEKKKFNKLLVFFEIFKFYKKKKYT